jgi:hypothetical protein
MSLETKISPLYISTSGMVVGSSLNSLISSLVASSTREFTPSLLCGSLGVAGLLSLTEVIVSRLATLSFSCYKFTSVF